MSKLGEEVKKAGASRAMLVTDKGIRGAGLLSGAEESLRTAGVDYGIFDDVEPDPDTRTVARCAEAVREHGSQLVVTLGGGSPICAGKGAALVVANGGNVRDYKGLGGKRNPPLPVIAIPSTAGSGSEVSPKFIITDEETGEKMTIGGPECFPLTAILDPVLLERLPYRQAVVSSLDAFSHAIEGFLAAGATPLTDALALGAVEVIYRKLLPAARGQALEDKNDMLLASSMGNIACGSAGLGLVHAMANAIPDVPHGFACGALLIPVLEFNLPACEPKMARMAAALGVGPGEPDAARRGIGNLRDLYARIGFPDAIMANPFSKTVSVQERVDKVFRWSGRLMKSNPRQASANDVAEIFRRVVWGRSRGGAISIIQG